MEIDGFYVVLIILYVKWCCCCFCKVGGVKVMGFLCVVWVVVFIVWGLWVFLWWCCCLRFCMMCVGFWIGELCWLCVVVWWFWNCCLWLWCWVRCICVCWRWWCFFVCWCIEGCWWSSVCCVWWCVLLFWCSFYEMRMKMGMRMLVELLLSVKVRRTRRLIYTRVNNFLKGVDVVCVIVCCGNISCIVYVIFLDWC